jgi:chloride channel 3/4/5
MTSRGQASGSQHHPAISPSIGSITRRWSALSNAEEGVDANDAHAEREIVEEIEEIRRYEDFTTIDWVQDAARAQLRRKAKRQASASISGRYGWRRSLWDAYDAGQAWIVVTLVGIAIGLNAAFLNIVTEWLSDIKLGYCTTAFYLNESFCCWGAESGCAEWKSWSGFWPLNYFLYMTFAVCNPSRLIARR